jgi:hypothetical protein
VAGRRHLGPTPKALYIQRPSGTGPTDCLSFGRATSVPFTTVTTGPQRTTTDNTTAPPTCAVPYPAGDSNARSGFGSKGSLGPSLGTSPLVGGAL